MEGEEGQTGRGGILYLIIVILNKTCLLTALICIWTCPLTKIQYTEVRLSFSWRKLENVLRA